MQSSREMSPLITLTSSLRTVNISGLSFTKNLNNEFYIWALAKSARVQWLVLHILHMHSSFCIYLLAVYSGLVCSRMQCASYDVCVREDIHQQNSQRGVKSYSSLTFTIAYRAVFFRCIHTYWSLKLHCISPFPPDAACARLYSLLSLSDPFYYCRN